MLVDAAHPEETRVVVLRGNRVEEFDFESANRKQLRGNIYLAKVTRVEPSLQAAFVDYGGNRHGFLAFSEIHPDYYQIPVADRQALIEAEEAEMAEAEARHAERERGHGRPRRNGDRSRSDREPADAEPVAQAADAAEAPMVSEPASGEEAEHHIDHLGDDATTDEASPSMEGAAQHGNGGDEPARNGNGADTAAAAAAAQAENESGETEDDEVVSDEQVESVGAEDAMEEVPERRARGRVRQYKIQEVIKRRQVLLVQVVKEERGNKGAALTTYLSLAGRYSVLMPNTARGGGISRKITSITDRKRLKQVVSDLEVPPGMGVILRTAGASRTKAEVKRDFEYLLRLWENVRELTLKSTAPTLVYEEGSLIKRSIRDLYNKDIDEVLVAGDDAYREAKDFMRMLMPSHAKNVKPYKEGQPLFTRFGIEAQLDAMFSPQVTLRSGGYIVINQTEALVSIDVNSGRSTREHNIEDTALQTNLEASDEVARQLRLRDLAGLIVIDFIDMEEKRNNRSVERKLKDALKNDRARIQVGRISHFGLLEMSRQRIRTGVLESTTSVCPTCQGTGHVRAPSSVALHVLRSLEDQLLKGVTHHLTIRTRTPVALYILNQKRAHLSEIEQRFGLSITVAADETIANGAHFVVERGEPIEARTLPAPLTALVTPASVEPLVEVEEEVELEAVPDDDGEETFADDQVRGERAERGEREEGGGRRRRRRRRGRGGSSEGSPRHEGKPQLHQQHQPRPQQPQQSFGEAREEGEGDEVQPFDGEPTQGGGQDGEGQPRRRRRGRRGGRRGRRGRGGEPRPFGDNRDFRGGQPAQQFTPGNFAPIGDADEIDTTPRMDDAAPRIERSEPFPPPPPYPREEVDTTPTMEPARRQDLPTRVDMRDRLVPSDEIDTTPQPERPRDTQPKEVAPEVSRAGAPPPEAEEEDPNRPKRSGWWQRKSFFG
jgi:ribonuclease E